MDVHEWHCNTKIVPQSKDYTRLSLVSYLRENMIKCKNESLFLVRKSKPPSPSDIFDTL